MRKNTLPWVHSPRRLNPYPGCWKPTMRFLSDTTLQLDASLPFGLLQQAYSATYGACGTGKKNRGRTTADDINTNRSSILCFSHAASAL